MGTELPPTDNPTLLITPPPNPPLLGNSLNKRQTMGREIIGEITTPADTTPVIMMKELITTATTIPNPITTTPTIIDTAVGEMVIVMTTATTTIQNRTTIPTIAITTTRSRTTTGTIRT